MPIHTMLYRCPRCGHDPLDAPEGRTQCRACGTRFEQGRGGVIIVSPPSGPFERSTAGSLMDAVAEMGGSEADTEGGQASLFREARIAYGAAEGHDVVRWRGEVLGFSEKLSWKGEGLLRLDGGRLSFSGETARGETTQRFSCLLGDIRGVQISSKALQITLDGARLHQFEFIEDSPKRWEDLVCLALRRFYAEKERLVTEFTPRIVTRHRP